MTINGTTQTSGVAKTVNLNTGSNTITIAVTAEDGTTIKTYTVTVNRANPTTNPNNTGNTGDTGGNTGNTGILVATQAIPLEILGGNTGNIGDAGGNLGILEDTVVAIQAILEDTGWQHGMWDAVAIRAILECWWQYRQY